MSRKRGLMNKLKQDEVIKSNEGTSFLFSQGQEKKEEEFEKIRQTIYVKDNLLQALKYKAFIEDKTLTDIYNEVLEQHLSEDELAVGTQRAREQ